MNTVVLTRIDAKTKKEAEFILKQLGLSLNDGIRMFISQVTLNKGMPFMPFIPRELNQETKQVFAEIALRRHSRLHANQRADANKAILAVIENPLIGEQKEMVSGSRIKWHHPAENTNF